MESLALEYIEKSKNNTRTFLGDLANALNIPNRNKSSRYGLFKTINENIISIRLSNHNATVSNFDNAGDKDELNEYLTTLAEKHFGEGGQSEKQNKGLKI